MDFINILIPIVSFPIIVYISILTFMYIKNRIIRRTIEKGFREGKTLIFGYGDNTVSIKSSDKYVLTDENIIFNNKRYSFEDCILINYK